jgi:hypothetical protein
MGEIGQLVPFDDPGKQASNCLLDAETRRKANSLDSAIAALALTALCIGSSLPSSLSDLAKSMP